MKCSNYVRRTLYKCSYVCFNVCFMLSIKLQRSQKYISMMPPDKQLFAAQLRRKQLQKQLPLHDLHPKFCSSLTESELFKFNKFCNKRRLKAAGVGRIMDVKEANNFVGDDVI